MQRSPDAATYTAAFNEVAKGTLDPEYQEIALAYALDRPIDGMDDLLTDAIDKATDPDGKAALQQASEALRGKKLVSDRLRATLSESTVPDGPVTSNAVMELANFDPTTQMLIAIPLLEQAGAGLDERDREKLASYAGLRKRRAKKRD